MSETSRQCKKILSEWDEIFITVSDFTNDLKYLPADFTARRQERTPKHDDFLL